MSTLSLTTPRRGKFVRSTDPEGFHLTDRVIAVLRAVGRERYLTSLQLAGIVGGSHQTMLRLLRTLYDHALLERPAAQRYQLATHDNRPLVYTLGHAGARILAGLDGAPLASFNWTTKTKRRTSETILHAIEVADDMRAFAKSFREHGLTFVDHHELVRDFPDTTRAPRKGTSPFSLRVEVPGAFSSARETISVLPDRLFAGVFPDNSRIHVALEHDRGTEPVCRWRNRKNSSLSFDGTSFARKLVAYHTAWQARLHTSKWGFKQLRVLTVVPSHERLETMLNTVDLVTGGKGTRLFAFTDLATFRASDPLDRIWIDGKRETIRLLE